MVATNDQFPLKKQTSPKGVSGIEIQGNVYDEDYLRKLQGTKWAKEADKMRTQDSQVKMCLASVLNPIRSATWEFVPADANDSEYVMHRDFVEFILTKDMNRTWTVFLNEILTFIAFGHSVFEIIHKNVKNHPKFDSYTGIRALSFRSPKTLEEWVLDDSTGELSGILQRSSGDFTKEVTIPSDFLLIFTIDLEGNYFSSTSRSWLRPLYGNYLMKQFLKKLKGIGSEKMTIGTPVGTIPSDANEDDENKFEIMLKRYSSNENQYLKLPEGYKIEILRGEFNSQGLEVGIEAENQDMVRSFLANFLNLGQGAGTSTGGSYSLGTDLSDFFLKGIRYIGDLICDTINSRLIPHIIDINFGEQEDYPKLMCSGIQDVGKEMSEIIKNYVDSGAVVVDDTLRQFVRKIHKLPPEDIPEEGRTPAQASSPANDGPNGATDSSVPSPSAAGPNPQSNEPDVSSDTQDTSQVIQTTNLQVSGRTIITKSALGLQEIMALNLDFIANKLIADITNRFKNLPENRKRTSTARIKAGGVNKYKKDLRATLTNIAALAINEAQSEAGLKITKFADPLDIAVDVATGEAKAQFPKLPRGAKDKILIMAEDIANAHASDLEKSAKFAANSSIETTGDADIIAQDIKEATNEKSKQLLASAPVSVTSEIVNAVRLEVFLSDEAKKAGNVGFQFYNPDPKSEICRHLADRIFSVDNKSAARYFPPLHFNCKSTLIPIKAGSPKASKINDKLGLDIAASGPERERIVNSIQFNDNQIVQLLSDLRLQLSFQSLLFDRKIFSRGQAVVWASMRGFATTDVEEVEKLIVIRQRSPEEFREGTISEINITQGVKAMAGELTFDIEPSEQPIASVPFNSFQNLQEIPEDVDVLTVIFEKDIISRERALEFLRNEGLTGRAQDEDTKFLRIRVGIPDDFISDSIKKIEIRKGITALIGKKKNIFGNNIDDQKNNIFNLFLLGENVQLQSLIFNLKNWTNKRAVRWAKDHGFRWNSVFEEKGSIHLKQENPGKFQSGSLKTIKITTGLHAVVGRLKNGKSSKKVSV